MRPSHTRVFGLSTCCVAVFTILRLGNMCLIRSMTSRSWIMNVDCSHSVSPAVAPHFLKSPRCSCMYMHVLRNAAYLCSTAARSTIHWTVLVVTAGVVVETLAYKLQYTVVIQSAIGYMCCSIATRNCNHNLFELISIHQLLNCNKRLQYVIATHPAISAKSRKLVIGNCNTIDRQLQHNLGKCNTPAISAKSQKTRVYTVMLCIWVKNQPYKQTRSAWHVVEVVRPG